MRYLNDNCNKIIEIKVHIYNILLVQIVLSAEPSTSHILRAVGFTKLDFCHYFGERT